MAIILTILYFIAWLIVFIISFKKNNNISAYNVIIFSYVVYAFASIFCYDLFQEEFPNITLFPYIYLFVLLLISLKPVKQYDRVEITQLVGVNKNILIFVFCLFILTTFIVLPSAISHLFDGFSVLLTNDDGAKDLYEEMHQNQEVHANRNGGIVGYCKIIRYLLFEISVFFLFYYLLLPGRKILLIILLLSAFLTDMMISLADGSRTGSTMSAFTILITACIFYRFYDIKTKKYIRIIGILIASLFLFFTIAVTIGRSVLREDGAGGGIIEYVGQANLYFNEYALSQDITRNGDRTCNYFKRLLGFKDVPDSITGVRYKYTRLTLNDHNFSTFIGDFALDFGPYLTVFTIIIFSFFFYKYTKPQNNIIRLDQLLVIQLVADICMHGGMYLFYYSFSGNFILLIYVVFVILLRINKRNVYFKNMQTDD